MAGTDSRFNATRFRDAIHFAMSMGQPGFTQDQLVFHWTDRKTNNPGDRESMPFNWGATPTTDISYGPITVPGAYEFKFSPRGQVSDSPAGQFDEPILTITLLDTEYPSIFDTHGVRADMVVLPNEQSYEILFVAPPQGLFDVTIYTIWCQAIDVS